jgi:hypothetical protein
MRVRQALFGWLASVDNLKVFTDFLDYSQQLFSTSMSSDLADIEPHNGPVNESFSPSIAHVSKPFVMPSGIQSYINHGLRFLGIISFADVVGAQDSTIERGFPLAEGPLCDATFMLQCVEAYTRNSTNVLARFLLIASYYNDTFVTESAEKISQCFAGSEDALVNMIQDVTSHTRNYFKANATDCLYGKAEKTTKNFYTFGAATDLTADACYEFTKKVANRGVTCVVSSQCKAPTSEAGIAALTLSSVLIAVLGVGAALTFMKFHNARAQYRGRTQPNPDAQNQLRERLI